MWDSIKDTVAKAAPLLGTALGGPAGGAVGGLIASVLGVDNDPEAIGHALKSDPNAFLKLQQLEKEHERELRRMVIEAETAQQAEINKTMRAELQADGIFKSGWRPFIGWIFGFCIGLFLVALATAVFRQPTIVSDQEFTGMIVWLFVAMGTVLGVNLKERTRSKQVQAGQQLPSLVGQLFTRSANKG